MAKRLLDAGFDPKDVEVVEPARARATWSRACAARES